MTVATCWLAGCWAESRCTAMHRTTAVSSLLFSFLSIAWMLDDYHAAASHVITSHRRRSMSNAISGSAVWLCPVLLSQLPNLRCAALSWEAGMSSSFYFVIHQKSFNLTFNLMNYSKISTSWSRCLKCSALIILGSGLLVCEYFPNQS